MSEVNLWNWLRPYLPKGRYDRIESGDTAPGIPDVHYRIKEGGGFLELKVADHPTAPIPFPNRKEGLHLSQEIWIEDYVQLGGTCWIVAQIGIQVFFVPGKYCRSFNGADIKRLRFFASLIIEQNDPGHSLKKLKRLLIGERV